MSTMRRIGNAWVNLDLVEAIIPDKYQPGKHVLFARGHIITTDITSADLAAAFDENAPHEVTVPDGLYALTSDEYAELKELDEEGFEYIGKRPSDMLAQATGTTDNGVDFTVKTRNPFNGLARENGKPHFIHELLTRYAAKL